MVGINTGSIAIGVSEGNRGGTVVTQTQDYMAAYRGLGLEDYVTFEADYAADGFDDVKGVAVQGLLRALMIGEEKVILGGNTSVPLGTTPQPTLQDLATGGTLAANGSTTVSAASLNNNGGTTAAVNGNLTVTTGGTTTNAGGTLQAGGTTTLSNGGLDNTSGKVFGDSVAVDTHVQHLSNGLGRVRTEPVQDRSEDPEGSRTEGCRTLNEQLAKGPALI